MVWRPAARSSVVDVRVLRAFAMSRMRSHAIMMWENTIASPAMIAGRGLHDGAPVRMTLKPADPGTGIVFVRRDLGGDNRIAVRAEAVGATNLGTVLENADGASVSTVEHLMAALSGLSIDNIVIELDNPEVPSVDGSSAPFVSLLQRAGLRRQGTPRRYIEVRKEIAVEQDGKRAVLSPCDRFVVEVEIEFDTDAIGRQRVVFDSGKHQFADMLASARTFGFLHEVEALHAAGRAQGASLENSVVIDGDRIVNEDGLRYADEFVRHKALDAIGDLYLAGAPILGRFAGFKTGHGMNNKVLRALLADKTAWRWRELAAENATARDKAV